MTTTALPHPTTAPTLSARRREDAERTESPRRIARAWRSAVVRRSLPLGGLLLALGLVHVRVAHDVEEVGKQLWDAHMLQARLEQERSELALEREHFRDTARIGRHAREKLGLEPARQGQIVEVK